MTSYRMSFEQKILLDSAQCICPRKHTLKHTLKLQWHARVYEEHPMLTEKLLQTTQQIKILGSESRVNKKWQTVAIIREIFYSNLETGRYG